MYGAIIGDVVGSVYEFDRNNIKTKEFPWLTDKNVFTDDTVMTVAVADAITECHEKGVLLDERAFREELCESMHRWGRRYPDAGYGGSFGVWLQTRSKMPYNSYGNGSAMRVSPAGWYGRTFDEALALARLTASVTHDHPEGIKGAEVVAGAIFLARNGDGMEQIRKFVGEYYDISFTIDDIRPSYRHVESCQETVPQALEAFFESVSFEDAVRNAISIGGDSDTVAAITGSVAEAYYGIDEKMKEEILKYLDTPIINAVQRFVGVLGY